MQKKTGKEERNRKHANKQQKHMNNELSKRVGVKIGKQLKTEGKFGAKEGYRKSDINTLYI